MAKRAGLVISVLLMVFMAGVSGCGKKAGEGSYPLRLVFVHDRQLDNPDELRSIREIAKTASEHGLNGMVILAGLDRWILRDRNTSRE